MDSIVVNWGNLWIFLVLSWIVSWFIGYTMSALWHKHVKTLLIKYVKRKNSHATHPS